MYIQIKSSGTFVEVQKDGTTIVKHVDYFGQANRFYVSRRMKYGGK